MPKSPTFSYFHLSCERLRAGRMSLSSTSPVSARWPGERLRPPSVSYFRLSCERLMAGRAAEAPSVSYFRLSSERLLPRRASEAPSVSYFHPSCLALHSSSSIAWPRHTIPAWISASPPLSLFISGVAAAYYPGVDKCESTALPLHL